jgi:type VI secretion system protein ImpK
MRKETADLVYPIFRQGLRIMERVRRGERLNMRTEQGELRRMFRMPAGAQNGPAPHRGDDFQGVRYPMACWLDEVFILDPESPWRTEFADESMEATLFQGSRLRAELFWEQARLAQTQGDLDALEVFYLCVMLGFRGDLREDLPKLQDWREAVEDQVGQAQATEWPDKPPELPLEETYVPPLRARDRLRWLALGFALVVYTLCLVVGAVLVHMGGN